MTIQPIEPTISSDELIAAPERFVDLSITQMHSIPQDALQEIQLQALRNHFRAILPTVPVLSRLAEDQNIHEIRDFADAGPLLLAHSVYKSYPLSVLEDGRFDQL